MTNKRNYPQRYPGNVDNAWGMIASVLNHATSKGVVLSVGFLVIMIIIVYRLPAETLGQLTLEIFSAIKSGKITGWVLFIILLIIFIATAKSMRRRHSNELKRIGNEKSELQNLLRSEKHQFKNSGKKNT